MLPKIKTAFKEIKRKDFLEKDLKDFANLDRALPIGWDQTISQPSVVAFMLEKLNPQAGQKIMDIGAGSAWTSALLANIVGAKGKVVAIEVIPELAELGKKNLAKYNFIKKGIVKYICQDGSEGFLKEAPYDKILVSAYLQNQELPSAWKEQLRIGGTIVVPIQQSVWVFTKIAKDSFEKEEYPGFAFVPFVQ